MQEFITKLKTELQKPLPGTEVQWQMASSDRMIRNFPRSPGDGARVAAVLILLYPDNNSIYTVLEQLEEVVFLFDADIKRLLDPSIRKIKPIEFRGEAINVKYFDYDGNVIWGATAMILHELLTIIREGNIQIKYN